MAAEDTSSLPVRTQHAGCVQLPPHIKDTSALALFELFELFCRASCVALDHIAKLLSVSVSHSPFFFLCECVLTQQ